MNVVLRVGPMSKSVVEDRRFLHALVTIILLLT